MKSGEAALLVSTKSEAIRIVVEKHKKMIGQRYIEFNEIFVEEFEIFDKRER